MERHEKMLQEMMGYTDEQLLEEFWEAETEWKQSGGAEGTREETEEALRRIKENLGNMHKQV